MSSFASPADHPHDQPPVELASWSEPAQRLSPVNEQAVAALFAGLPPPLKVVGVVGGPSTGKAFLANSLFRFPDSPFARQDDAPPPAQPAAASAAAGGRGIWVHARRDHSGRGSLVVLHPRGISRDADDAFNAKAFAAIVALCDTLVCSFLYYPEATAIDDVAPAIVQLPTLIDAGNIQRRLGSDVSVK